MFYEKLLYLCQKTHVAPSRVAEEIGKTRSCASSWKIGSVPNADTIAKIADFFSIDPAYLEDDSLDIEKTEPQAKVKSTVRFMNMNSFSIPVNSEDANVLKLMQEKPSLRLLFHSAKTATEEEIIETALELERMKRENENKGTNRG